MIEVSAPASSANLGSGFDALAIALTIRMYARARPGRDGLRLRFSGSELPAHEGIAKRFIVGMALAVSDPQRLDLEIEIENHIPLGVGLGSSATALVCGMAVAGSAIGRSFSREQIVRAVSQAEGHADNAAAAVHGGLCIVLHDAGTTAALSTRVPRRLFLMLVVPDQPLDTDVARQALPQLYTRSALSISIQRSSLLVAALMDGHYEHLRAATRDVIHQPYRGTIFPGLAAALNLQLADAVTVLSGSGPTVLVLSESSTCAERAAMKVAACFQNAGVSSRAIQTEVALKGLEVESSFRSAARSSPRAELPT